MGFGASGCQLNPLCQPARASMAQSSSAALNAVESRVERSEGAANVEDVDVDVARHVGGIVADRFTQREIADESSISPSQGADDQALNGGQVDPRAFPPNLRTADDREFAEPQIRDPLEVIAAVRAGEACHGAGAMPMRSVAFQ